jgi:hypothetical protein
MSDESACVLAERVPASWPGQARPRAGTDDGFPEQA